jgi:hypothetical protein
MSHVLARLGSILRHTLIREPTAPRAYVRKLPWRMRHGYRVPFLAVGLSVLATYALLPSPLYIPRNHPWSGLALGGYLLLHTLAQHAYGVRHTRRLCTRLVKRGYSVCPRCDARLEDAVPQGTCARCGESYNIDELRRAWEQAAQELSAHTKRALGMREIEGQGGC